MFSNLVHLCLIRTVKSRWFPWGLALVLACFFIYVLSFYQVIHGDAPSNGDSADVTLQIAYGTVLATMNMNMFWQETLFSFAIVYFPFFAIINTAFMACDYYKYRLFINYEGAVSNKWKIVLADCCAISVFSFVLTILAGLLLMMGMLFGDTEFMPVVMTKSFIGSLLSLWFSIVEMSLLVYLFSQMTRSKAAGASLSIVFSIIYGMITNTLCVYLMGRSEALSIPFDYDLFVCFTSPANYFSMALDSEAEPIRIGLLMTAGIVLLFQFVFVVVLSMIFAARRREA